MALEVNVNKIKDIVVVSLTGNLDTNTAPVSELEINKWLEKGADKMIINLEKTKYVSSAGLRIFLATAKKITANQGALKLCSVNEVVKEILDISGFSTILDVRSSEKEAIAAF